MRISTSLVSNHILARLQANAERLFRAQDQLSSGRRLLSPSDDPPSANRAATLRSGLAAAERYVRATDYARGALSQLDSVLGSIADAIQSVRDIALEAANTAITEQETQALAAQVENLVEVLVDAGNSQRIAGIYMFGGNRSTQVPFVTTGADPPVQYLGDSNHAMVEIGAGIDVAVSVAGDLLYNMGGVADPALDDLFSTLETLRTEILAGDANAVSARIADIDEHLDRVLAMQGEVGARLRQVEFMADRMADSELTLRKLLSETEDADLAEAAVELQTRENIYEATAAVVAAIHSLRLLDYL